MGSRYTTQIASGYNSSPPADDGSQSASNLITWAGIKTKVGDPVKNLADAMNTALVTAFDYSTRQITASDSVAASDHMKVVEIAPTVTVAVTVTLPDAATMTSNFRVWVRNSSAVAATVARATGGDTIDGAAANITLQAGQACLFGTTASAAGYLTLGAFPFDIQRLTADTAPTVSDVIGTYDDSAALHKKVTLSNFLKIINGLTEDTSPDAAADYVATYDASASTAKKVLLNRVSVNDQLLYQDQKASGTSGNGYTAGAWRTVILNTEVIDTAGIGSLASNAVTLPAGSYEFTAFVNPGTAGGTNTRNRARLRNTSDGSTIVQGVNVAQPGSGFEGQMHTLVGSFTIAGSKTFELQIYPVDTTTGQTGLSSGDVEVYASIRFRRFAA